MKPDTDDIKVIFLDEPDRSNPLGIEASSASSGSRAVVANAVYHAVGKRVRDLPITLDKMIGVALRERALGM